MCTTYLFAGGGTGGHIFPGLAIAERLGAGARAEFLVSDRPLDAEILARAGAEYRVIPARPFGARPAALARFLASWGAAVRAVRRAIREARRRGPVHVAAMGGFVAAPAARAAALEGVPVTLVNLDAVPGKANRWIARRAHRIVTAAPVEGEAWERVPPIVRTAATTGAGPAECRTRLGLDPDLRTLLVTGGSQGARSINVLMGALVRERGSAFNGWQVIHQCGPGEEGGVSAAYAGAGVPAVVRAFFGEMGVCWGASDLAVSRAGAGSVAEAWAAHVPTVFLPYPYHRDRHQRLNALPLERAGGAVVMTDRVEAPANLGEAGRVIADLLADGARRESMRRALLGLGPADGAERVARILRESAGSR